MVRVTAYDIAQAGSMQAMIEQSVVQLRLGKMEDREFGASVLRTLSEMRTIADEDTTTSAVAKEKPAGTEPSGVELEVASMAKDNIALIAQAGAIKPLVAAIADKDASSMLQRDAAASLANIARKRPANQEAIAAAEGIKPLARLLRVGDAGAMEQAAAALASVSESIEKQDAIIAAGAVVPLIALLKANQRHEAQIQAAQCLANLATVTLKDGLVTKRSGQLTVAKAGAIQPLVSLLASGKASEAVSHALGNLSYDNLQNQQEICKHGGIARLLPPLSAQNIDAQCKAAAAIANLIGGERSKKRQNEVAKAGGLRPILALVESRYRPAQVVGLHALAQVVMNNRANQDEIARLEGLPPLVALIGQSASTEIHTNTARALTEMVKHNYAHQTTVSELGVISMLVSLLRSLANERSRPPNAAAVEAEVAGALCALAEGHEQNQRSIASAGANTTLVFLLASRYERAASLAANALASIALDNEDSQKEIAKQLVTLLTNAKRVAPQERAAASLWRIVRQNPSNQMAIASAGGAKPLVQLLRSGPQGGRSFALWALSLCIDEQNQGEVVDSGAIEPLVALLDGRLDRSLESSDVAVIEQAAGALNKLATKETVVTIMKAGAISPLISLLDGSESGEVRQHAAGALSAIAIVPTHRQAINRAGGISPLVALLTDPGATPSTKKFSAAALGLLSNEEEEEKKAAEEAAREAEAAALRAEFEERERQEALAAMGGVAGTSPMIQQTPGEPAPDLLLSPEQQQQQQQQQSADQVQTAGQAADPKQLQRNRRGSRVSKDLHPGGTLPSSPGEGEMSAATESSPDVSPSMRRGQARSSSSSSKHGSSSIPDPLERPKRKTLVAEEGAIAPLVALLTKEGQDSEEEAAGALRALAENAAIRMNITESGGIGPLVALLGGSNPKARENAEGALVRLSTEMANRVLIIEQLVAMLYKEDIAAREQAAAAIANLAHESTANCISIVDAGGIPPLLALLESDSVKAKENSASAITQLARGSRPNQDAITKAGGIPMLVAVLTASSSKGGDSQQSQIDAIITHSIWMMAKKNFANQVALAEAGVIAPLVSMLGNASPELQLPATGVIECLLQCKDIQAAVVRTGAIAPLCMLSREGELETQEQAAAALWSLATDNTMGDQRNTLANKTTIAKLGGIESLVKMFVTGGSEKSQKNAAGALSSIASRHVENRSIVARRIVSQLNGKIAPDVAARTLAAITRMCGRKVAGERQSGSTQIASVAAAATEITADQSSNQGAIAKVGGVQAIISWLGNSNEDVQKEAAHALLAMATNNYQTQQLIAKVEGLQGLIAVINNGSIEAQEHAASALWHLASSPETQQAIADADGIAALVGMLGVGQRAAELAAVTMVRLAQGNPAVSVTIADVGGVRPLVKLLSAGSGPAQQAAATLAELALVSKNRDSITNTGGIEPLIKLLSSHTVGTPEVAARALAHLARSEGEGEGEAEEQTGVDDDEEEENVHDMKGADERRAHIKHIGGLERLIAMLDGSNLEGKAGSSRSAGALWGKASKFVDDTNQLRSGIGGGIGNVDVGIKMGMQEQAAAALAEFANGNSDMQDAIIEKGGVPKLLALVHEGKAGNLIAQEHAARTLWHLSTDTDNQKVIADSGCIPELVGLVRNGSPKAAEVAAGALSNIARGSGREKERVLETQDWQDKVSRRREVRRASASIEDIEQVVSLAEGVAGEALQQRGWCLRIEPTGSEYKSLSVRVRLELSGEPHGDGEFSDDVDPDAEDPLESVDPSAMSGVAMIKESKGIEAIVSLMGDRNATPLAKENGAAALWHLARDTVCREIIAHSGGIAPLVNLLNDGTHQAHRHASDALARLANQGREHQSQIAKKLVGLLMTNSAETQQRAAHALQMLAVDNPGSQTVIVNAGAISPLVHLLSTTSDEHVKKEVADALETIVASSGGNDAAVSDLVMLLGMGSLKSQELVAQLLCTLCSEPANRESISKSGALQKLVIQLTSQSLKVQELSAAVLSYLSCDSASNVATIAKAGGVGRLVSLLASTNADSHAYVAAALADLTGDSEATHLSICQLGGIAPLVSILKATSSSAEAKAEAAGALGRLSKPSFSGTTKVHERTQSAVVQAGAIPPLVELLKEDNRRAQRKAATAVCAIVEESRANQDTVAQHGGVPLLVQLLEDPSRQEVQAHAAEALSEIARDNTAIQTAIAAAGGIPLVITMLQSATVEPSMEAAAAALRKIVKGHAKNQVAVAAAGGIMPLVSRLALAGPKVQSQTTRALFNLAPGNADNIASIATLLVKLLGDSTNREFPERAARAIAELSRGVTATQDAIAEVGGIDLLVSHLQTSARRRGSPPFRRSGATSQEDAGSDEAADADVGSHANAAALQLEVAAALRSMATGHPANQTAVARAGGIPLLIGLLKQQVQLPPPPSEKRKSAAGAAASKIGGRGGASSPAEPPPPPVSLIMDSKVQREAAGALWMLAADAANRQLIADSRGIQPLIELLAIPSSQETASGALCSMAASADVCTAISEAEPIVALSAVVDKGSAGAKDQAAGCLTKLIVGSHANQEAVARELVTVLSNKRAEDLERASQLAHDLSLDVGAREELAKAGVIPHLVRQVETGTDKASDFSAGALAKIVLVSAERRGEVTHQLINARHRVATAVPVDRNKEQRAGRALHDANASTGEAAEGAESEEDGSAATQAVGMAILLFRLHTRDD